MTNDYFAKCLTNKKQMDNKLHDIGVYSDRNEGYDL